MGIHLNSKSPFGQFLDEVSSTYSVDKSKMLEHLLPLAASGRPHIEQIGRGQPA